MKRAFCFILCLDNAHLFGYNETGIPKYKKAELFVFLARGQGRADSDVDLLIEFATPRVSLLTLNGVKYRLEELLGLEVDIVHSPIPKNSLLEIDKMIDIYFCPCH